ncbi:gephyrin-like molybdotransferase receptor GlpR [Corynebacterium lubricantis]|uniref:divisome protein SepX/GlpR n=1 Tax=Corynebacterium lubricantis TaxID=541095 RepID=UPI0003A6D873|nr:gephyrin-like molybdotransferase receptor GlpR [Corynebacterium lubricantis]
MDGTLVIVLIVVVWIFVLAPVVLGRNNKPIRKSGEAYDETRVLHEGGTEPVAARRRPKLTANDVHRYDRDDAEDLEVVEAVHVDQDQVEDTVLIDDTKPHHFREFSAKDSAQDPVRGTVRVEAMTMESAQADAPQEAVETATNESVIGVAEREEAPAELVEGEVVSEATEAEPEPESEVTDAEANEPADTVETISHIAPEKFIDIDEDPESTYPMDDSYLGVDDVAYSAANSTVVSLIDDSADADADAENESDNSDDAARAENGADGEDTEEHADLDDDSADQELTEAELEFAKARRGRGSWDPESDDTYKLDRYQRRQRTFLALCAVLVLAVVFGFFVGGWAWGAPVIVVGLIVWYLVALRSLVKKERALRARRVRQLRRARLGVKSSDAQAPVPRELRRPGAIILESDDDSPDFDHLPMTYGHFEDDDEDTAPRPRSRRVG